MTEQYPIEGFYQGTFDGIHAPDGLMNGKLLGSFQPMEAPPDPEFVYGFTEPTDKGLFTPKAVAGPRVPETSMRNYGGSLTNVQDGEILDRLVIPGIFRPRAKDWVLQDSITEGGAAPAGINELPLWDMRDGANTGGKIIHSLARASDPSYAMYGYKGGNADVYRSIIERTTDGTQPHGSGSIRKYARFFGTLIRDLRVFPDPTQKDKITHNDDKQASGNLTEYVVFGCALHGGRTSSMLTQQQSGTYDRIAHIFNWFYGDKETGSTYNTSQNGKGVIAQGGIYVVIGNRFDGTAKKPLAWIAKSTLASPSFWWWGNVDMATGEVVLPTGGAD